jgi:alpha-1,4-digalacturonate transport system substrate-binding protein
MDWFAQEKIVKEFSERTLFLPGNKAVVDKGGLNFKSDNEQAKAALNVFVESTKTTSEAALKLPGWRWSDTVYAAIVTRIGQTLAGELKIDDAFTRIDSDIAQKVKDAGK